MIAAAAILFLAILFTDIYIDINRWKRGPFGHKSKWIRGVILLLPVSLLAVPVSGSIVFNLLFCWALVGFAYWTLFDGLFNLFRRLPWNYVGVPDNWDAASDKLERIYPWFWKAKILIAVGLKICYIFFLISS